MLFYGLLADFQSDYQPIAVAVLCTFFKLQRIELQGPPEKQLKDLRICPN